MRIGAYVDAFNLYYGARHLCGRGSAGWRWLDVRRLVEAVHARSGHWPGATVEKVVYCTARVSGRINPAGQREQDTYLKALVGHGAVDHIEYGTYVARTKRSLLAEQDSHGRPVVVTSWPPVIVKDGQNADVPDARFLVQTQNIEEKGSDVNVATHLLLDAAGGQIDAALVISNDSDLRLPIHRVRDMIPAATVNPTSRPCAGDLRGVTDSGAGNHWWAQLTTGDLYSAQMPGAVGPYHRPAEW